MRGERRDVFSAGQVAAQHTRNSIVAQDQPGGIGPLFVIERTLARRDLAPSRSAFARRFHQDDVALRGSAFARRFHQDDVALRGAPEAGFEEVYQRHPDVPKSYAFDPHSHLPSRYVPTRSDRSNPITARLRSKPLVRRVPSDFWISRARLGSSRRMTSISAGTSMRSSTVRAGVCPASTASACGLASHHSATQRSVGNPPCSGLVVVPY